MTLAHPAAPPGEANATDPPRRAGEPGPNVGATAPRADEPGPGANERRPVHALLDAVFRNSSEAVVIADGVGAICYATAGATLLTGHDAESMIGSSVFDFLHPDDVVAAAQLFARRLEYDGADLGHEIRLRHSSGDWVATLATASLLPDGAFGACAITLRSITDSGLLERSLRSRIVVGEYTNRLSAGFMDATHSAAAVERIQTSLGEIGLLTGAEVVEVLLERQQRGSVERLAHWVSAAHPAGEATSVAGAASGPKSVDLLLSEEFLVDDTSMPPSSVPPLWRSNGIASLLSTPFEVGDQRGVIVLMRVAPGPSWSGADAELIRGVASLYGRALQTARSDELLALTYSEGPFGFAVRTWDGRLVDCNQRYLDINRLPREAAERSDLNSMLLPEHRPLVAGQLAQLKRGEIDRIRVDVELTRGDDTRFWGQIHAVPLQVPGSSEHLVLTSVEDVTETHRQRIELEHAAHHDPLTGLANRTAMTAAIDRLAAANHEYPALLFVDLDRFKFVNDSLGHTVGDALLKLIAERITAEVRAIDVVARLGGDEFAIVVPTLTVEGAHCLARRLQRVARDHFEIDGRSISQTLSIGIAIGEGSTDAADLLVRADRALNAAKTSGRSGYVIYDESLEDEVVARLTLERELRSAIAGEQLEVHFQPEFDVLDGRILGAEALLRWRHPDRGLVTADQFIAVAESTGLIEDIGRFALRAACRAFAPIGTRWPLTLRVNISAREFARPELPALVRSALAESGLTPERLCLEMTETTLMDTPDVALETFARLRSIGVQSAIDDFGTGYSSLAYLKRFPVDAVKIDRTFVEDLVSDPDSRAIVGSIMGLSGALSFQAVAEGVETIDQLRVLRDLGCVRAQGFLVAPALPPEEFARFVDAHNPGLAAPGRWPAG